MFLYTHEKNVSFTATYTVDKRLLNKLRHVSPFNAVRDDNVTSHTEARVSRQHNACV
jgi:hypothetical protein